MSTEQTTTTESTSPLKSPESWGYSEIRSELEWYLEDVEASSTGHTPFMGVSDAIVGAKDEIRGGLEEPLTAIIERMENATDVPEEFISMHERTKRLLKALDALDRRLYKYEDPEEEHRMYIAVYDITDKSQAVAYEEILFPTRVGKASYGVEFPRDTQQKIDDLTEGYEQVEHEVADAE